jgi:signal transduction histidine kinase
MQTWRARLGDFLSGGLPQTSDPVLVSRVRHLNGAMLTMIGICVPFVFQYASLQMWHMVGAVAVAVSGALANLWFIRRHRRVVAAGYIVCGLLYVLLVFATLTTGGFDDPNFAWFYIVPLAGAFLVDIRTAWVLTALVLLTTLVFWLLPGWGIQVPNMVAEDDRAIQSLANRLGAILAIGIISWLSMVHQQRNERALESAIIEAELESQRARALAEDANKRASDLERAHAEIDRFTHVSSHDLRAPLHGISKLAEFVADDLSEVDAVPEDVLDNVNLLRQRAKRLDGLLMSLIEYSRVGRTRQRVETVDTGDLVDSIVDSLAIGPGFEVERGELPTLFCAKAPLRRVVRHLINNAIKHHDRAAGHVAIRGHDSGTHAEVVVEDDGPGIPRGQQAKVFEIFTTLKRRDELEASGMGLALARKIVELEGGVLELESEGRGCRFCIRLPHAVPAQQPRAVA